MRKSSKRIDEGRAGMARGGYEQAAGSQEKAQEQIIGGAVRNAACTGIASNTTAAAAAVRLRKSCDSCVRLKRACNGESPCRLCARMGKLCSRSAKKRSGPPKGTKYQVRRNQAQQVLPSIQQTMPSDGGVSIRRRKSRKMESAGLHLPPLHGAAHKVSERWAECDQGETSFVRRVAHKIHHHDQQEDPLAEEQASTEQQPDQVGNEEATQPAVEVEDGARLLLRTLKTFHPLEQTLGLSTNLARFSCDTWEARQGEQERLPSLFDLGAVSSPAYLSDATRSQVYDFVGHTGHNKIASERITLARPRLAEIARPRTQVMPATVDDARCHRDLPGHVIISTPMMAAPSFPRYLHPTTDGVSHADTYSVAGSPQYRRDGRAAWAAECEVKNPSTCVFDPYAQDWMPAPPNFAPETKSRSHGGGAGPGGSVAGITDAGIGGALHHRRVDTGGFPAAPAGHVMGAPGVCGRFARYARAAMYGNISSSG